MQTFGRLGVLFFLMLMFLCQLPTTGQNKKFFVITGKIVPEIETSEKGVILMSKSGAEPTKIDIPQNGRFKLDLEYFNEYTLTFTLAGHFSKTIIVSTDIPQEVWKRDNDFPPFPMIVQLFKEIEGIDKSFTLKPSGRVFYGKQTDNFEKESIFNDIQIAEQIQTATTQSGQVKKEVQTITKQESLELAAKQKNFDQLIADADFNFKKGDYPLALTKYQEAQKLFPEKAYANDRIAELQDLLKALELTEKRKTEIEQKYKDAIIRADGLFAAKTYKESQLSYKESLQYKPDDAYASGRIQEINQLLAKAEKQKQFDDLILQADNSYKSKNFDQAISVYNQAKLLIPENEYPQNQINLINQEKQQLAQLAQQEKDFNQTIQSGDNLAKQKDFLQAINLYKKALGMKPDSKLATDKIAEMEQAIAIIETDKKYQETIQQADQALAASDLQKAKMLYQEALKLKSSETYPKNKLAEIALTETNETKFVELLANAEKEISGKNYDESVNLLGQALKIKPKNPEVLKRIDEVQILKKQQATEKEFDQAILLGDQQKSQGIYDKAISSYRDALKIKPNNELALGKISDVEQILAGLEKDKQYQAAIAQADKSFDNKDYAAAQTDYRKSLTYKPEETYPTNRIKEIDSILLKLADDKKKEEERQLALAAKEKAYTDVIARADKAFGSESYDDARKIYTEALSIKPNETYPTGQISKIDGILAEKARLQQIENGFLVLVGKGDAAFDQKDYEVAKTNYTSALGIKPNAADVKTKIKNIDDILKKIADDKKKEEERQLALAAKEKAYTDVIARADKAFGSESYDDARKIYTEALTIKPNETYPTGQISKIEGILAEKAKLQQIENNFQALVGKGDAAFDQKDYEVAKTNYTSALGIKPNAADVKAKIKNIDDILKKIADDKKKEKERQLALAAKEKAYTDVIARADKAFGAESYDDARKIYTEALTIKPNEAYPTGQISKIDGILAEKARLQQIENDFLALVGKGDAAFDQKDYEVAKTNYTSALGIKPKAADVKAKIKNIDDILKKIADDKKKEEDRQLALAAATEKAYNESIDKGNKQITQKTYSDARVTFQEAKKLKPTETLPDEMIAKIDSLIAGNERELADARLKEEAYQKSIKEAQEKAFNEAMAKANKAFNENDFKSAKTGYEAALVIKAADPTAKAKLGQTEAKLAELARLTQAYNAAITAANKFVTDKRYPEAKEKYEEALQYLPDSDYPKSQIEKLNALLAQAAAERQKEELYASTMKEGEALFTTKDYSGARPLFAKASELKPAEPLPVSRMKEIDKILNDLALEESKNKTIESSYQESLKRADKALANKEYPSARLIYGEALSIKPNESYPKDQIRKIDDLIAKEKATKDSLMRVRDAAFNLAIASAKESEQSKQYQNAILKYKEAIAINTNERGNVEKLIAAVEEQIRLLELQDKQYKEKIGLADQLRNDKKLAEALAEYRNASNIKPTEEYPKNQIAEIQKLIAAGKGIYATAINNGDQAFDKSEWQNAKTAYNEALKIQPDESYPKNRLVEIDQKILAEKDAALKDAATTAAYNEAMEKGEKAMKDDQLTSAKMQFNVALKLKPNESLPPQRIREIDALIEKKNQESLTQAQRDIDEKYRQTISLADNAFKDKNYTGARPRYQEAQLIKPDESYPKDQIALIDKLMTETKPTETFADKMPEVKTAPPATQPQETQPPVTRPIVNPVEPAQTTQVRTETDQTLAIYDEAIRKADDAFKKESYNVAKFFYNKALEIKPLEKYPKDRIQEIQALTNSMYSEKEEKAYRELIAKADEALVGKDISIARFYYNKAIAIKKDESYPKTKLKDIQKLIDQDKLDQYNQEYTKLIELADQAMKSEDFSMARFNYNRALNMKPDEKYPKDQLKHIKEAFDKPKKE